MTTRNINQSASWLSTQLHPFQELDIWDEFNGASGQAWPANTYSAFISGADSTFAAEITAGTVVKTDRGNASDGATKIYTYAAGDGHLKVLLLGGVHAEERLGMFAAARWFETFVKSQHPVMAMLRKILRVTYCPFVNPSRFGTTRVNANDVDINRNFDFYWSRYVAPNASFAKGSAPFSEAESTLIKTLVDEGNRLYLDCHNVGASTRSSDLLFAPPSTFAVGKRDLCYGTAAIWQEVYDGTIETLEPTPDTGAPMGANWASAYMLWNKNWWNSAAMTFEANADLGGSTTTLMTREAAQKYCGFITMYVLNWLANGQQAPIAQPMEFYAARSAQNTGVAMSSGGTLLDTTTTQVLTFDIFGPGNAVNQAYIDMLLPCPGSLSMHADGYFEGGGTAANVTVTLSRAFPPNINTFASDTAAFGSCRVEAGSTDRATFSLLGRHRMNQDEFTGDNRVRARLLFLSSATGVKLLRARLFGRFTPNTVYSHTPALNG